MDSDEMHEFFLSTEDEGFVTLTYYTSGARSFYTKDKAIRTPEDLKGLKIRVQDMESQTDMLDVMGGTPVAMSYGDVYTSLQTVSSMEQRTMRRRLQPVNMEKSVKYIQKMNTR